MAAAESRFERGRFAGHHIWLGKQIARGHCGRRDDLVAFCVGFVLGLLILVPSGAFDDEVGPSDGQAVFVWIVAVAFATDR
jgi:hypothetical protein